MKQWFPTSSDLGQEFAKFFEEQKKQIAALEGVRESGNLKAIEQADKELNEIMSRARAAAADARNQTAGSSSFKTVLEKRAALEKSLKKPALKDCTPEALARLEKEFKELSEKTRAQEPSAAMAALAKFEDSLAPVLEKANNAKKLRAEIKTKGAEAEEALKPLKTVAKAYYAKLLGQLKKARADGKKENGERPALTLIATLKAQIDQAVTMAKDQPSALAAKEKGAKDEDAALEKAKVAWESNRDVFEKLLAAASQAVAQHPEGDKTQTGRPEIAAQQGQRRRQGR